MPPPVLTPLPDPSATTATDSEAADVVPPPNTLACQINYTIRWSNPDESQFGSEVAIRNRGREAIYGWTLVRTCGGEGTHFVLGGIHAFDYVKFPNSSSASG